MKLREWACIFVLGWGVAHAQQFQPTSYGAALVSPSGSGNDWAPATGTGTGVYIQPNNYVGLLICTANCTNPLSQQWSPLTALSGGSGTVSPGTAGKSAVYTGSTTIGPSSCLTDTGTVVYTLTCQIAYGIAAPMTNFPVEVYTGSIQGLLLQANVGAGDDSPNLYFHGSSRWLSMDESSGSYRFISETSPGTGGYVMLQCDGSGTSAGPCTSYGAVVAPLFKGSSGLPTMAAGAAAGTSPSCTTVAASSTNISGVLTCTTGTATATGTLATITFSATNPPPSAPMGCQLTPRNAATAPTATAVYTTAPSTTTWTIGVSTALTASTAYSWSYQCI